MPSDPAGRNPSGALIRPAPDFFDDHMAAGGYSTVFPTGPFLYLAVSLYNDGSGSNRLLKVYGIDGSVGGDVGLNLFIVKGTFGSFVAQGQYVRFDQGAAPGQIWQMTQVVAGSGTPSPFNLTNLYTIISVGAFGGAGSHLSPFPLAIIPPGYSLTTVNYNPTVNGAAAFFWQVADE